MQLHIVLTKRILYIVVDYQYNYEGSCDIYMCSIINSIRKLRKINIVQNEFQKNISYFCCLLLFLNFFLHSKLFILFLFLFLFYIHYIMLHSLVILITL